MSLNTVNNQFFEQHPEKVLGEFSIAAYMNKIIVKGSKDDVVKYFDSYDWSGNEFGKEKETQSDIQKLEQDYEAKNVDELIAIKKKLYPNPDIESAMTPEEKLLDKVIAKKFSDIQSKIHNKHKAKKQDRETQEAIEMLVELSETLSGKELDENNEAIELLKDLL